MKKLFLKIIIIGFFVFIITSFFYQCVFVKGDSMLPTYKHNQFLIIKKFNFDINRNDVVVFNNNNNILVKRIVGIPGDYLEVKNKYLYVNNNKFDTFKIDDRGIVDDGLLLKENEYFALGDNRNNSIDSRHKEVGIINFKDIIGKVIW